MMIDKGVKFMHLAILCFVTGKWASKQKRCPCGMDPFLLGDVVSGLLEFSSLLNNE